MRKSFLYPALNMLKEKRFRWVISQILKYLDLKVGRLPGPIMGFVVPTYRCNSNCKMCNLISMANGEQKESDTSAMKTIIDEFHDLHASGINFTGGEPLLRDDIFDLMEYAKNKKFVLSLCTNGILLDEEKIKTLLEIEPDTVNISLDASNREAYSKIRGVKPEMFDMVIDSIRAISDFKKMKNKKTSIILVTAISGYDILDIDNIIKLGAGVGADRIAFTPLHAFRGNAISCKSDISISAHRLLSEAKKAHIQLDNSKKYLDMCDIAFRGGSFPTRCYPGPTSLIVDCYRNVYPCWPFLELGRKIANTKSKALKEIWYSQEYHKTRQEIKDCRACFWDCHAEMSIFLNYL